MIRKEINTFMDSVTSQNITFNRDIEMRDLEGNTKAICQCYCTIVAFKSCSYYFDVLEAQVYEANKLQIQTEIDAYIAEAKELAGRYNVPMY